MNDFSDLTVIAAHDVYVDTSSTFRHLEADMHDNQRVLFGTDYPTGRHKYCVESFLKLGLG